MVGSNFKIWEEHFPTEADAISALRRYRNSKEEGHAILIDNQDGRHTIAIYQEVPPVALLVPSNFRTALERAFKERESMTQERREAPETEVNVNVGNKEAPAQQEPEEKDEEEDEKEEKKDD